MHFLRAVVREWGHEVTHLVEELRYKPEGCEFDSGWGRLNLQQKSVPGLSPGRSAVITNFTNSNKYSPLPQQMPTVLFS
jgi:hypothetical protein